MREIPGDTLTGHVLGLTANLGRGGGAVSPANAFGFPCETQHSSRFWGG